jgi:HD-GYP domain-containing protein (c-di-GMP phosphodiesterase class II)
VWDLFNHILQEKARLEQDMRNRPLFLRRVKDLRQLKETWQKLLSDQNALMEYLSQAPAELAEYNQKQIEKELQRREEMRRQEYIQRISSARRSLDLAIGYLEQLHREGRVTFGSQILQLEEAQRIWNERLNKIFEDERSGALNPDEVILQIYNLESMVRELPSLSMRVREVEEKFTRLVTRHDMLASLGKTVIPAKEIARMTIKLHEQIPQLWANGDRQELEHAIEVLESFVSTYENTVETELTYLERRRPGATRSLVTAVTSESQEDVFTQVSAMARSLISAIEARDRFLRGHSEQVSVLVRKMAAVAGMNKTDADFLVLAALMHDVGKISVPEAILSKVEPLTEDDWHQIQMHPYYGAQILKPIDAVARIVPWVYHHHERWDGRGYPDHLTGRQIPVQASYISVAEAFAAMLVEMPQRPAMSKEEALHELRRNAGTQFNPEAIELLETVLNNSEEKAIVNNHTEAVSEE